MLPKGSYAQETCPGGPYSGSNPCPSGCYSVPGPSLTHYCVTNPLPTGGQIKNPVLIAPVGAGQGEDIFAKILAVIITLFFIVGSLATLIYFLMGALSWITSGGEKQGLETAKNRLTAALVGIIVLASTFAVLQILGSVLGIDFFKDLKISWPTIG